MKIMNIVKEDQENKGVYKAMDDERVAGAITFSKAGENRIILDHTEVDDAYKGQGVGKIILLEIIEEARKSETKILPLCPFTKAFFDKNVDYRDVL